MKLISNKSKISPYTPGVKAILLESGDFKEKHITLDGSEIILKYDIKIKTDSGITCYACRNWFSEVVDGD